MELLEAGTGFSEFAFLVGLLAKPQNFRVYISFWTRIVPLPLHGAEPRGDVFRS